MLITQACSEKPKRSNAFLCQEPLLTLFLGPMDPSLNGPLAAARFFVPKFWGLFLRRVFLSHSCWHIVISHFFLLKLDLS